MRSTILLLLVCAIMKEVFPSPDIRRQVYIVYFGPQDGLTRAEDIEEFHYSYLLSVKNGSDNARESLLYSYKNSINGFAAVLSSQEAAMLSEMEGVVSVFRTRANSLFTQTTRSWEFMDSLEWEDGRTRKELLPNAKYGEDVIVGLLDTGIWPESDSFSDEGMQPVRESWKGICQVGEAFNRSHCNRKVVGARFYTKGYEAENGALNTSRDYFSPRDHQGHGSHTASILGGREVAGVSAPGGLASGTATGGAPMVRLAVYKVCWPVPGIELADLNTCSESDVLAAFDDALGDGVDILSVVISYSGSPPKLTTDAISLGGLHAEKRNVVVISCAGNDGPAPSTVSNLAPWILSVAASSMDRDFPSPVTLGDRTKLPGQSATPFTLDQLITFPITLAGEAGLPNATGNGHKRSKCLPGSLHADKVRGKIVVCLRGDGTRAGKGVEVKRAGGAGIILANGPMDGKDLIADSDVIPGTAIMFEELSVIEAYINSTGNPVANIEPARTRVTSIPAPFMASFSGRGPNPLDETILKPDITAPGFNIIGAWSEASSPTLVSADNRTVKYNIYSGTSMSCPHVAAAAALVKAIHPDWSPAAIRSALLTTAKVTDNTGGPITDSNGLPADPFSYGAGHLQPAHATDPGLVYNASYTDYLLYLCRLGIQPDPSLRCYNVAFNASSLNHPSIVATNLSGTWTVQRSVTNVGNASSVYALSLHPPSGASVYIHPEVLVFNRTGQQASFTVTLKAGMKISGDAKYSFGWFTWNDGCHTVRSPIAVSIA